MPLMFNGNYYEGFIKVRERRYFIRAHLSDPTAWEAKDVVVDWRLHTLLNDSLYQFIEKHCQSTEFTEFFKIFEKFVESTVIDDTKFEVWNKNPVKLYNFHKCLEQELNDIENFIRDVNVEEGIIQIETTDSALRVHKAVLKLNENYPKEPIKIISHDLPLSDKNSLQKNIDLSAVNTISGFCKRFAQCIEAFQDFWNCVSILDANCWILDPENPTFKDTTRRIKISDRISVVLVFNPYMSRHRPDIKFLGCHSSVAEFREILQKNLENELWDPEHDILNNLMNVLEVTFPAKVQNIEESSSLNLVNSGECAICFIVRLEDEIPSIICDNINCTSYYHSSCLFKYLSSVPGNKSFFGRIQGECPNCDQVISCPVPSLN